MAGGVRRTWGGVGGAGSAMVSGERLGACGGCRAEIEDCADSVENKDDNGNVGLADATAAVEITGLAGRATTGTASALSSSCTSSPFIMPPCATAAAPLSK